MTRRPKRIKPALVWVSLALAATALAQQGGPVAQTKHNLSASGPGPVKVAGETEVCKFCHTPHAARPDAPLWNRGDPGTYYQTYTSTTLKARVGQPTGASRLCLSCHDGTIALTQTLNRANPVQGTLFISASDAGHIGTDLTDDHPISFTYDSALAAARTQLRDPATLGKSLPLDSQGQLQCTTCHDPHSDKLGFFLRKDNRQSALCTSCHNLTNWVGSTHATSARSVTGARRDSWSRLPYTTVQDVGCESCHRAHNAGGPQRLLRHEAEEDNCFSCHDGSVASKNLQAVFQRSSAHRVTHTTGVHEPGEDPSTMQTHVECSDCHNPHQTGASLAANAPLIKPSMTGASGVTSSGSRIAKAIYEYEVCYKCHAGAGNSANVEPVVNRIRNNFTISNEFKPTNASYHPVEAQGKNSRVPSLMQGFTTASIIYCTDCHGAEVGTARPKGPHGSDYRPMLVRNYLTAENTMEGSTAYALCYQCHNRTSILADEGFDSHKKHLAKNAPCSACHDPHGVTNNTHLINFDRDIVFPSDKRIGPIFADRGDRRGSCTLKCHGVDHDDEDYEP